MADKQFLHSLKKRLAQGELEAVFDTLAQWLEQSPEYAELARVVRVNQSELYQTKAEVLKGTVSSEEARLTYNKLTDKALQIIAFIESGRTSFGGSEEVSRTRSWRYYLTGGLITLAAVAVVVWFFRMASEECPRFDEAVRIRIAILPFMGASKEADPAIDIMDELNDWIERSPNLRQKALAAVHRHFDIEKNYPNSAEAIELAQRCGLQMLVWGKVRKRADGSSALDVRYRLIDHRGNGTSSDTTLARLLSATEEAALTSEPPVIARMLYIALSNYYRIPVLADALKALENDLAALNAATEDKEAPIDTTLSLLLADYYIQTNQTERAIAEYNKILEYYPDNQTAHLKRGALFLKIAHYEAAARDLEAVPASDTSLLPAFRQARIEAFLKSSQPEKAKRELEQARQEGVLPPQRLREKREELRDSLAALQERRDLLERKAARTLNPKIRLGAAKANLALGNPERAADYANEVLRQDPRNTEAIQVAVEAEILRGDTARALQLIEQSIRKGATVKGIPPLLRRQLPRDSLR
ncbi:MAG: hypothetical protein NZM43_09590 [Saprospiraceae bacterium]|nr:hypothetical protein [Saprospiraceae bacterium]MDW8484568.1 hypothetical protein [Saprospiraceae bacterium]